MDISIEVLHAIPGRMRVRIPDTKNNTPLAEQIADRLMSRRGVTAVRVSPACASVLINYDTAVLGDALPTIRLKLKKVRSKDIIGESHNGNGNGHKPSRLKSIWKRFSQLILPTAALGISLARIPLPIISLYGIVGVAAAPVFARACRTIWREKRLGVDFLDATAIAIMGIQRNLSTCAFMAWLIGIGEQIREETARKSQKAIADLVEFNADFAIIIDRRKRRRVPVNKLCPGIRVIVNAGEIIPVDGAVVGGRAGIDQRSLTGESTLIERSIGDKVYAGSIAMDGELIIQAEAVGLDTRAGKIVQMLRSAPAQETKIEDYAARFADKLVLPTFAGAGFVFAFSRNIARALSMLIVDFGTGVRVAAPTAFLSSMAFAAQRNIVIKGGRAMEKLAGIDTIVFDKTGTLTTGTPEVRRIISLSDKCTPKKLIKLAAASEFGLNHPVANALVDKARELGIKIPEKLESRLRVGMGVKAAVRRKIVAVGSEKLLEEEGIDLSGIERIKDECEELSESPLYIAINGSLAGVITYADKIRPESRSVISRLKEMGINDIIMLTGDRENVAAQVARDLGVDHYVAEVFPDKKLEFIKKLRSRGRVVAMVGDGINDSLALANADVAIAPACANEAAKEAADVLLMEDDLNLLVEAYSIALAAITLVKQNYKIVAVPNAGAIALAASGLLGPPGATLINNGSTVAAGLNGLRPLLPGRRK